MLANQQKYWEEQNKKIKTDPNQEEKAEQYGQQQAYIKATPEDKRNCKFFKELPIEDIVDDDAIKQAKKMGLTDPEFLTGRMSNEVK